MSINLNKNIFKPLRSTYLELLLERSKEIFVLFIGGDVEKARDVGVEEMANVLPDLLGC